MHTLRRLLAFLPFLLSLLISGCVFSLVAPYGSVFDRQIRDFHQETAIFLAQMSSTSGSYSANRQFYAKADGTIETLRTRAILYGEKENRGTLKALDLLDQAFDDLEEYHRAGPLVADGYRAMRNTPSTHFRALLQVELHKKQSAAVSAPQN